MDVGRTLYVKDRKQWRAWLSSHHRTSRDIWLIYYTRKSGKARIPYNDAVEEALCYGWIDSLTKPRDQKSWVQRFTPRRKGSILSELNKARVRKLIKSGRMRRYGLDSIRHHLVVRKKGKPNLKKFVLPKDILESLKSDPVVWKNFVRFSESYKQIRIGWIDGARKRPEILSQRLRYFARMTAKNKKFGMVQ